MSINQFQNECEELVESYYYPLFHKVIGKWNCIIQSRNLWRPVVGEAPTIEESLKNALKDRDFILQQKKVT